jgi:hypothetical protein
MAKSAKKPAPARSQGPVSAAKRLDTAKKPNIIHHLELLTASH